jgi:hypothetical protein
MGTGVGGYVKKKLRHIERFVNIIRDRLRGIMCGAESKGEGENN